MDSELPLFVDKYYQAKALSDMIVVVQNRHRLYPSRLGCNGKVIYQNLRNPLKPLLSAVALNIGGLVSTHITYNEAHHNAIQNWLWSVGDNALSHTSRGVHFNRLQIDTLWRNQLVDGIQRAIELTNEAVDLLQKLPTDPSTRPVIGQLPLHELNAEFYRLAQLFVTAGHRVIKLQFDDLGSLIDHIDIVSKRYICK